MRAARLTGPGRLVVESHPDPEPAEGQVLVRMSHAGLCGSDLERVFGSSEPTAYPGPPGYPGHEGVGVVVHSRANGLNPGDLVLTVPEGGHARAFATLLAVDATKVLRAPDRIEPVDLLMAQQLGTAIYALDHFWPGPPHGVAAVFGTGPAGLHFAQLLKLRGFETVIAVDLSDARLAAALRVGADVEVNVHRQAPLDVIMQLTGGAGATLVVDATGRDDARVDAMRAVAEGGVIGLYGLPEQAGMSPFPFQEIFRRQPVIKMRVGAQHEPGLASFRKAIDLVADGAVRSGELVSHILDLEEIEEAFDLARSGKDGALKVCVRMPAT